MHACARILACADEHELDRIPFCTRELDARAHWVGFASPAVFGDPSNGKGGYRDTVLSRERKRLLAQRLGATEAGELRRPPLCAARSRVHPPGASSPPPPV